MALRQGFRLGGEVAVNGGSGFAALGDGPDHQGLAAAHIAGGKDAIHRGHVAGVGGNVAAVVEGQAQLLDHAVADGAEEAHGQQDEIGVEGVLGAGDGFELGRRADANQVQPADVAVFIAGEAEGIHAPIADAAFLVRVLGAQLQGPERPGSGGGALGGRLGHDLELVDALCALAQAGAEAIGAGIAAADDDHALALGVNGGFRIDPIAFATSVLLGQELHGEVNPLEFAAGNVEVAGLLGTAAELAKGATITLGCG